MSASLTPLTDGRGALLLAANPGPNLASVGYTETEYLATGSAVRYSARDLPASGRFEFEPGASADFATRVIVRTPTDPTAFNGTLVVEWLNVSSGQDAGPGYTFLAAELVRRGYTWAGVSAQYAGVEDTQPLIALTDDPAPGLAAVDPDRYADIHHPGDAYCYDMYTQIAASVRDSLPNVERTLAIGESQSAMTLSTYVNGVQPLSRLFDGFLIHSRGGAVAPLGDDGRGFDLRSVLDGTPTVIRDVGVPVIVVETETDLFGDLAYYPARQADSPNFRLWEIAGTAHADKYTIGQFEPIIGCSRPLNRGQQAFVLRAALRALDTWVRTGHAPPTAARLDIDAAETGFVFDAVGNVVGGVRTPAVDVPVSVLSGTPAEGASTICALFGTTDPLTESQLRQLYSGRDDYLTRYASATDAAIAAGFVLPEDRAEILALAEPAAL